MKKCKRCNEAKLEAVLVEDRADVAGHIFMAQLPGDRCTGCGAVAIDGSHVKRFELCIASELAKAGYRSHEAFKFIRGVLELDVNAVAQLCGVDAELVELWDAGRCPVTARASALLSSLVLSRYEDRGASIDALTLLRVPRRLARTVRISLENALAQAAKALDFGSQARTTPALC